MCVAMPCCCCFRTCSSNKKHPNLYSPSASVGGLSSEKKVKVFSYSELRWATNNFNRSNKIGRGGFGTVYKGRVRNGQEVAVKVLSALSRQGIKEFLTEIDVIANVKHPNLLELVGCCVEGNHRILVYEFMEKSSLHRALLSRTRSSSSELGWSRRRGVCIGVARSLAFLHQQLIVHRDIKASNILLAADYSPRIGDFGLAKLFPDNATHISTRVAGTTGYLAPEYAWFGQLTNKADVYSFGVLLLETLTGRSSSRTLLSLSDPDPADNKVLVERTWEHYQAGNLRDLMDPALPLPLQQQGEEEVEEEVVRYMKVALLCTQAAPQRRPSMAQVVEMLSRKGVRVREKELTPPGYVHDYLKVPSSSSQSQGSADANNYSMVAPHTASEITPR